MNENFDKIAGLILESVDGYKNIELFENKQKQIVLKLKENTVNINTLSQIPEIENINFHDGTLSIELDKNISKIYSSLSDLIEKEKDQNTKAGGRFIDVLASVFSPVLGILAATGMIKGLLSLCLFLNLLTEASGTYSILYAVGDGFFYFMPIFLGATAAKRFGLNEFIGMAIATALVYPTITALSDQTVLFTLFENTIFESQVYSSFLGIPVILPQGGYTSTVIPIILAVFVASVIYKLWEKVIPELLRSFLAPTLTLLLIVPLTFIVVGPIASVLSTLIETLAQTLYNLSPMIEGAFIGAFWQVLVIFGLHWAFVPIMLLNLNQFGYDSFMQGFFASAYAQMAVVLAIMIRTKNKELKELCIPAAISGFFGISEPAIYGVTLPRVKYFIIGCLASAVGGALIGMMRVKMFIYGGMGLLGLPSYIDPQTGDASSVVWVLAATILTCFIAFIVTFFIYKDDKITNIEEFNT